MASIDLGLLWALVPSDLGGSGSGSSPPRSLRLLVVEDEGLVALEIQAGLELAGHEVVGVAEDVASAGVLARTERPDLALVDVRLARGESGLDVAADLAALGVPCLFVTGNCPEGRGQGVALGCLHKPFDERQLTGSVAVAAALLHGHPLPQRLPMGLHLYGRAS
ncbi:response regulator [Roseomonas nepalensis]|uniref:Response regulator n=1 Tax=Muricoccus nepalensis TaxID=1854500 RepID=A0A502FIU5_9PROT|nr:response regulator [Roseomonas nepalensis]TPG49314.1 response regulator [Roseomonas nepalensis]